ncbi:MAG: mycoredoxin-dependent peroxiredoxin [Actinomycetota bacterium]|nr:mycoredoxin-dependent peroxiredoxin [Actinomycetota bacterium]
MTVEVGTPAPDFELTDQHGQTVRLSDLRGHKAVVLVFYPFAFTGVCSGELHALQDERSELDNDRVALLAVSTDSMYSLRVFAEKEGFDFAMLSDFWPHGEVAAAYGVLNEAVGAAMRGTFVIDRDGVVRWTVLHGLGDARDVEDYKKALAEL